MKIERLLLVGLALCLLTGCGSDPEAGLAPAVEGTATPEVTAVPTPAPTPEPTPGDPFAWVGDYEGEQRYSSLADFSHMPLDELPQEILDSLTLVEEKDLTGIYPADWGYVRTYTAPGLELHTTAPSAVYLEYKAEVDKDNRDLYPTEEDFWAEVEGEEGREWLIWTIITDERYATQEGLHVGMTVEEAEVLGYPLSSQTGFGGGAGVQLKVTVEDGVVTELRNIFFMGRYIGKFFEM